MMHSCFSAVSIQKHENIRLLADTVGVKSDIKGEIQHQWQDQGTTLHLEFFCKVMREGALWFCLFTLFFFYVERSHHSVIMLMILTADWKIRHRNIAWNIIMIMKMDLPSVIIDCIDSQPSRFNAVVKYIMCSVRYVLKQLQSS